MMRAQSNLSISVLLLAVIGAGCGQREEVRTVESDFDNEEFRTEVMSALDRIRSDLASMKERIPPDVDGELNELASSTEEARSELLSDLDRLSTATVDEAREIQRAAANRLAELEAEVSRREISAIAMPDSLVASANSRLGDLEDDIQRISERVATADPNAPAAGRMSVGANDPVTLRERAAWIRSELVENVQGEMDSPDSFTDAREQLSEEIAELTEEVRRRWYEREWGIDG